MRKMLIIFLCCFIFSNSFGQKQRIVSTYLLAQYNHTQRDYTLGNNPWGMGLGLQAFLNNKTKFKPTIEITADIYLEDDKVLRSNPDGSIPENGNDVGGMTNLLIGSSFHPNQDIYVSFVAGPSFIGDQTLFAIKPSLGFYFSKTQRLTVKLSYINVFNRTKIVNEDFSSISLALGLKLF